MVDADVPAVGGAGGCAVEDPRHVPRGVPRVHAAAERLLPARAHDLPFLRFVRSEVPALRDEAPAADPGRSRRPHGTCGPLRSGAARRAGLSARACRTGLSARARRAGRALGSRCPVVALRARRSGHVGGHDRRRELPIGPQREEPAGARFPRRLDLVDGASVRRVARALGERRHRRADGLADRCGAEHRDRDCDRRRDGG